MNSGGVYLQDQMTLTPYLQLIAGARLERFDLSFHNYRNAEDLERDRRPASRPARAWW